MDTYESDVIRFGEEEAARMHAVGGDDFYPNTLTRPVGLEIPRYRDEPRDLIGRVERTPNGENVAISIGIEHGEGWEKVAHVTLSRTECLAFMAAFLKAFPTPEIEA